MYNIYDAAKQFNLSVDDVRSMLMDVRDDWDSAEALTFEQYELIRLAVATPQLPEGNAITPVENMPIEQQQQIVENASQVLGRQILLSIQERVELAGLVDKLTNQVILSNRNTSLRNLAAQLAQSDESVKGELLQAISTLQGLVNTHVPMPQRTDAVSQARLAVETAGKKMVR